MKAAATAAEEKAFAAEKSAAWVRFAVIVFNTATYYAFLWPQGIPGLAYAVTVAANAYGVYVLVAQPYRKFPALTTTTWTAITDGVLITLWLAATGGFDSPYYLLWYLSLVAVTLRYDRAATWVAAVAYSLLYTFLVAAMGGLEGRGLDLSIRVAFILLQGALGAQFAHETVLLFEERFRLAGQAAEAERFRALAEAASEAIAIHEGPTILEANQAYADLVGRPRDQVVGADGLRLVAPESQEVVRRWLAEPGGEPVEGWVQRPDGSKVLVRARSRPLQYHGRPARVTTLLDVTKARAEEEARGREREREMELRRLKEMDRMKTDFLNAAAHELKTPLTPLRLQVHMLQRDGLKDLDKARRSIAILERNLGRLALLVDDMLDVARLEAGRLDIDLAPTELGDLVGEAVETFQDLAGDRGVTLAYAKPPPLLIPADGKRVTQILYNLLSNALKFTPEGGRVEVRALERERKAIVEVQDTGRGFTPGEGDLLFQPFSQLSNPVRHEGTGLGLYVSRGIAERHGGALAGESPGPGQGALFRLTLPAR